MHAGRRARLRLASANMLPLLANRRQPRAHPGIPNAPLEGLANSVAVLHIGTCRYLDRQGLDNPSMGGASAAVISTPRSYGRGGVCACTGRKPKGVRGSPMEAYQLPDHQVGDMHGICALSRTATGPILAPQQFCESSHRARHSKAQVIIGVLDPIARQLLAPARVDFYQVRKLLTGEHRGRGS